MLTTFILVGMVDSFDPYFATVELNTTPASNGGPSIAVMPVSAFPCEIYEGKVVKIMDFGAFVNFVGKKDGLVHISAMAPYHVDKVSDICNEGDTVKVKVMGFDDRGKVRLSMKVIDQETGEDISGQLETEEKPKSKLGKRRQKK